MKAYNPKYRINAFYAHLPSQRDEFELWYSPAQDCWVSLGNHPSEGAAEARQKQHMDRGF